MPKRIPAPLRRLIQLHWRKALIGLSSLVFLCAFAATMALHRDRMFHGKRESQWIQGLSPGEERQVEQWRDFSVEGVRVLVRAFDNPESPAVRLYRKAHSKMIEFLPAVLTRKLPTPRTDMSGIVRLKVMRTMSQLDSESKLEALPAAILALDDPDPRLRNAAVEFFIHREDGVPFLHRMQPQAKADVLPHFEFEVLDQSAKQAHRINGFIALGHYSDQRERVAPFLVELLKDPDPVIGIMAAQSLNRVAPDLIVPSGAVPMLVNHINAAVEIRAETSARRSREFEGRAALWVPATSAKRGYHASGAVKVLGEIGKEPGLAVPALIAAVQHNVGGINAVKALASFPEQAEAIAPVLLELMDHRSGNVRLAADWALNEIEAFRERNMERSSIEH